MNTQLQEGNRLWWEQNPMSYDWRRKSPFQEGTPEFFQEIDQRFFSSSPSYKGARPFARLIPFADLKGERVLEVGCGLGTHAQLLASAGCSLTAIDISPRAVELTKKRLSEAGLTADVRVMDAEEAGFADGEFDFVWSWGVIHHSARPQRIIQQMARVLRPGGEFRVMVYNRRSATAMSNLLRGALTGKFFQGMSASDVLNHYSDGYLARFYTRKSLKRHLLKSGFASASVRVLGQRSDLFPVPPIGPLRWFTPLLVRRCPDLLAEQTLARIGGFLFARAVKENLSEGNDC